MIRHPVSHIWLHGRLLPTACRIHGNLEMGEHVAKQIFEMEPENVAGYVLLLMPTGISVRMLNSRERKEVKRNSGVAHELK
jgi:hypothetical protein